jgi:transcriptional regulator with XRE-family HTH domain
MARGWRKRDYNRQGFGQQVREYRLALRWSLGQLAQQSGLNKGTLQHVEKGETHIPAAKRQIIIDVLTQALQQAGQPVSREAFLQRAGLEIDTIIRPSSPSQEKPAADALAGSQGPELRHMSHEAVAELLNQQHRWQLAGTFWLLAAREARQSGDRAKWSRCTIRAGLMALTCSQFEIAEQRFKEVIEQAQAGTPAPAVAEAHIRLGWLYYEQDRFREAAHILRTGGKLLQMLARKENTDAESLRFSAHGSILPCEGHELIVALEATRSHWLGRTYVDWGMQQDNQEMIQAGLAKLQKNRQYDGQLGHYPNVGFAMLRQVPALLYQGEVKTSERYLAQSEELLDRQGTTQGHLALHKGMFALEERPEKAMDILENAREGFTEPIFYAHGLSETFKEISSLYLMDDRKSEDERALQYALAAAVLHPYSRNIELLQLAARKMYWRMGENRTAFNTFWQTLEERLWRMDAEPFSDLRYLMKAFPENGISYVETSLEKARHAVQDELSRKG